MKNSNTFHSQGTLDLTQHCVSEKHLDFYMTIAVQVKQAALTRSIFTMMVGHNERGTKQTLLFHQTGRIEKTSTSPTSLFNAFSFKDGGIDARIFRKTLNFLLDKPRPKYPSLITPDTVFSRLTEHTWVCLNDATGYRTRYNQAQGGYESIIDFSFQASLNVNIGLKSIRNTFRVDVLESWTVQKNNFFGGQPLTECEGVINPHNTFMSTKIEGLNKKIEKGSSQIAYVTVPTICAKYFMDAYQIMMNWLPLKTEGYIDAYVLDYYPDKEAELFKTILAWFEKRGGKA